MKSIIFTHVTIFLVLLLSQRLFAPDPPLIDSQKHNVNDSNAVWYPHLYAMPKSYTMPDTLMFLNYWVSYNDALPPMYAKFEPNIVKDIPTACLYASFKIDQYGNSKIYAGCSGSKIHNWREYPPLYPGDVFPVLDQLYYFDSHMKVIKVLGTGKYIVNEYSFSGKVIIPLTPLDVLPEDHPFNSLPVCRSSSFLRNESGAISDAVSFVRINTNNADMSVLAIIYTDYDNKGSITKERLGKYVNSFQTKKEYKVGDILICRYEYPDKITSEDTPTLTVGFKLTKIVPPDPERKRVFKTVEGEKTGRLIGWVELDPNPIPIDENGNPIKQAK